MQTKPRDVKYCNVDKTRIKRANPVLDEENMGHLMNFIVERYRIHVRKDILHRERPWTEDPVLDTYKFTNVFREDDRVSQALIHMVSHNPDLSYKEKVLNTFFFRAWNNPHTFKDLGGPWTVEEIYSGSLRNDVRPRYRRLLKEDPERKWWSSAYNQGAIKSAWKFPLGTGAKTTSAEAEGRPDYEPDIPLRVFNIGPVLKTLNTFNRMNMAESQEEVFRIISEIPGFANFMAYQVFVDLTYIEDFPFSENEFVVAGPGCKKGLDLVFDYKDGMTYEECLFWLRDNIDELFKGLEAGDYAKYTWRPEKLFKHRAEYDRCLNVMALENCFCELSKYVRTVNGTGRPRCKYVPTMDDAEEE
jgi:hypothetical protein